MNKSFNDYDIVSFGGNNYIVRSFSNKVTGSTIYALYTLDGKLYKTDVPLSSISFVSKYNDYVNSLSTYGSNSNYSVSSNNKSSYSNIDECDAISLDRDIGSLQDTLYEINVGRNIIDDAKNVSAVNDGLVDAIEDVNNSSGLSTDASIDFLKGIEEKIETLGKNLENNNSASISLHNLNISLKSLLDLFNEKKDKEKERKEVKERYDNTKDLVPSGRRDSKGNEIMVHNDLKDRIKEELDRIDAELSKISIKIQALQSDIDSKYNEIKSKYGDLLNFNNSDILSLNSNNSKEYSSIGLKGATGSINYIKVNNQKYAIYVPDNYENQNLPLILYLHGRGGGSNIKSESLFSLIDSGMAPDAVVISPLMSSDKSRIQNKNVLQSITSSVLEIADTYGCDKDNIDIVGYSNGASTAYRMIATNPNVYNKCISIAGEVKLHGIADPENLKTTQIIEIHGDKDVSAYKYNDTYNQIQDYNSNYGTDIKLISVDAGHGGKENIDETAFTTSFISPFTQDYDSSTIQSLSEENGNFYLMDWLLSKS